MMNAVQFCSGVLVTRNRGSLCLKYQKKSIRRLFSLHKIYKSKQRILHIYKVNNFLKYFFMLSHYTPTPSLKHCNIVCKMKRLEWDFLFFLLQRWDEIWESQLKYAIMKLMMIIMIFNLVQQERRKYLTFF